MIRHIFKLIWSRKKKSAWIIVQLFVAFLALFVFIGLNFQKFTNYFIPLNYQYDSVWAMQFNWEDKTDEQVKEEINGFQDKLKSLTEVEVTSLTHVVPFFSAGKKANIKFNKAVTEVKSFEVDENYNKVIDLKLIQGRWFKREDYNSVVIPVVVTESFARLIGNEPVGKIFEIGAEKARIIGVSPEFKENISENEEPGFFRPISGKSGPPILILKSKYANNFIFLEEKIRKAINSGGEGVIVRQSGPLTLFKKYFHKTDYIQLTLSLIVFGFLVINIFLGISGVFSYNFMKRKPEVGLREAIGADGSFILKQFLGETMMLASVAILPAIIIALQFLITEYFFPWMTWKSGMAGIIGAAIFIYFLMFCCALYPAMKASRIQPAEALREE